MKATVSVRVPGKVMLCGEYSVLSGGRALAATLDRHLAVRVRPKSGLGGAYVASDIWDQPRFVAKHTGDTGEPLLDAVAHGMKLFDVQDFEIRIDSELDIKFGFGSSSALRLGVLLALDEMARFAKGEPQIRPRQELEPLAREAFLLQKKAQSKASGYDVATQLVGGLVEFEMSADDSSWTKHVSICDALAQQNLHKLVHLFGGGAGAPTTPIVTSTLTWLEEQGLTSALAQANDEIRQALLEGLKHPRELDTLKKLFRAVRAQRKIFDHAPSFPKTLAKALEDLPGCDESWSFKTTGAGGEDALLLFGPPQALIPIESTLKTAGWYRIPVGFESAGARVTRGAMPHA